MTSLPNVPDDAIRDVAEALLNDYDAEHDASHLHWRDFAAQARKLITAAAPHIREQVAAELREDAEAHRRVVARKPSQYDEARLARARTLDDAASRITRWTTSKETDPR